MVAGRRVRDHLWLSVPRPGKRGAFDPRLLRVGQRRFGDQAGALPRRAAAAGSRSGGGARLPADLHSAGNAVRGDPSSRAVARDQRSGASAPLFGNGAEGFLRPERAVREPRGSVGNVAQLHSSRSGAALYGKFFRPRLRRRGAFSGSAGVAAASRSAFP